ncbi:hypothetical protein Ptr902_12729 [Pyrenophora tritici-repentis]|nr:hypothetical protein Ptr902_12729 [Pyrenophora tritici-repentis]
MHRPFCISSAGGAVHVAQPPARTTKIFTTRRFLEIAASRSAHVVLQAQETDESRARMLPPTSTGGDDTHGNETGAGTDLLKEELTDGAINTLYDIIQRAQTASAALLSNGRRTSNGSRSVPSTSSALFRAYEQVLAEQGLEAADDAILHRFLFRMQEDRRDGEGLTSCA